MKEVLNVLSKAVQVVISRIAVSVSQSKRSSQTAGICSSVMLFSKQMTMIVGHSVFLDLIYSSPKQTVDKIIRLLPKPVGSTQETSFPSRNDSAASFYLDFKTNPNSFQSRSESTSSIVREKLV